MNLSRQNWVLIDFENVHKFDLALVANLPVQVLLFVGPVHKTLPTTLFQHTASIEGRFHVVVSAGSGNNALDFQMAFEAGRIISNDPSANVHFVSKDQDFEILIKYMRSQGLNVGRSPSFDALPFLSKAPTILPPPESGLVPTPANEGYDLVYRQLEKNSKNRPQKLKTLKAWIINLLGKSCREESATSLIEMLQKKGIVALDVRDAVTYPHFTAQRSNTTPCAKVPLA